MRDHMAAWKTHEHVERGRALSSVATYEKSILQFAAWLEGNGISTNPAHVTREDVSAFHQWLFYNGCPSNSTRAQKIAALRCFWRYLNFAGVTDNNPLKGLRSPRIGKRVPRKFSTEQLALLFDATRDGTHRGVRDLAILMTLYAVGIRKSELTDLDIEDLQDGGRYIRLRILGKGAKERTLSLRAKPAAALREWLGLRATFATGHTAVFVSLDKHERLTSRSITNVLKKYAEIAGIARVEAFVHKMRATWAADLFDSGRDRCTHCGRPVQTVDLYEIAALAGWGSIETAKHYISISEKVQKKGLPDRRFTEIELSIRRKQNGGDDAEELR